MAAMTGIAGAWDVVGGLVGPSALATVGFTSGILFRGIRGGAKDKRLADAEGCSAELGEVLVELEERNEAMAAELNDCKAKLKAATDGTALQSRTAENEALRQELERTAEGVYKLEAELDRRAEEAGTIKAAYAELYDYGEETSQKLEQVEDLETQLQQARQHIQELEEGKVAVREILPTTSGEPTTANNELQMEVNRWREDCIRSQAEATELKEAVARGERHAEETLAERTRELESAQEAAERFRQEAEAARQAQQEHERQTNEERVAASQNLEESQRAAAQVTELKTEHDRWREGCLRAQMELDEMKAAAGREHQQNNDDLARRGHEVQEARSEAERLGQEIDALREHITLLEEGIQQAREESHRWEKLAQNGVNQDGVVTAYQAEVQLAREHNKTLRKRVVDCRRDGHIADLSAPTTNDRVEWLQKQNAKIIQESTEEREELERLVDTFKAMVQGEQRNRQLVEEENALLQKRNNDSDRRYAEELTDQLRRTEQQLEQLRATHAQAREENKNKVEGLRQQVVDLTRALAEAKAATPPRSLETEASPRQREATQNAHQRAEQAIRDLEGMNNELATEVESAHHLVKTMKEHGSPRNGGIMPRQDTSNLTSLSSPPPPPYESVRYHTARPVEPDAYDTRLTPRGRPSGEHTVAADSSTPRGQPRVSPRQRYSSTERAELEGRIQALSEELRTEMRVHGGCHRRHWKEVYPNSPDSQRERKLDQQNRKNEFLGDLVRRFQSVAESPERPYSSPGRSHTQTPPRVAPSHPEGNPGHYMHGPPMGLGSPMSGPPGAPSFSPAPPMPHLQGGSPLHIRPGPNVVHVFPSMHTHPQHGSPHHFPPPPAYSPPQSPSPIFCRQASPNPHPWPGPPPNGFHFSQRPTSPLHAGQPVVDMRPYYQ